MMIRINFCLTLATAARWCVRSLSLSAIVSCLFSTGAFALSSPNIPLDSPVYGYLEKLAGMGLITTDFRGIRPFSRSEVARLLEEATANSEKLPDQASLSLAQSIYSEIEMYVVREKALRNPLNTPPSFDWAPFSSAKARYVYLDGTPRSYERQVHDPGGDGVFGIGSGLRPSNPYPSPAQQHGTEGTPLLEDNKGNRYGKDNNGEFRFTSEVYAGKDFSALLEPLASFLQNSDSPDLTLNKGYLKVGGGRTRTGGWPRLGMAWPRVSWCNNTDRQCAEFLFAQTVQS